MASHTKSEMYNDIQELTDVRKSLENKSPVFVPLNGLSQSAKDRLMNKRTVKPPKNINLIEGDPVDNVEFSKIKNRGFPNEYQLSSTIKEVNGMDYSNYCIEQHYRTTHAISPDISKEDLSNSLSVTSKSSDSGKCDAGTNSSIFSNLTGAESFSTESDLLLIDSQDDNLSEADCSPKNIGKEEKKDVIGRLSKNAAIMGLLRKKLISVTDLNKNHHKGEQISSISKDEITQDKNDNNSADFNSRTNRVSAHPYLVPHPEDPEFFTHPLQAYGKVDDMGINCTVRSNREKTIITPRQYYIREGLNDDVFKFQTNKSDAVPEHTAKFSFPSMTCHSRSPKIQSENPFSSRPSSSRNSLIDQDDDQFVLNRNDFPTL